MSGVLVEVHDDGGVLVQAIPVQDNLVVEVPVAPPVGVVEAYVPGPQGPAGAAGAAGPPGIVSLGIDGTGTPYVDPAGVGVGDDAHLEIIDGHYFAVKDDGSSSVQIMVGPPAMAVQYTATTFVGGGGDAPIFGFNGGEAFDDGLDGVFCQVDAVNPNKINFLSSGTAAISVWGLMYNPSTTGGILNVIILRGGVTINRSMEVGAKPAGTLGGTEVDLSVTITLPVSAGDSVRITQQPEGSDNTGCYTTLMITRL